MAEQISIATDRDGNTVPVDLLSEEESMAHAFDLTAIQIEDEDSRSVEDIFLDNDALINSIGWCM